jgi:hypothetical protein
VLTAKPVEHRTGEADVLRFGGSKTLVAIADWPWPYAGWGAAGEPVRLAAEESAELRVEGRECLLGGVLPAEQVKPEPLHEGE